MTNTIEKSTPAQVQQEQASVQYPNHNKNLILAGGHFGGGRMMILDEDGFIPGLDSKAAHGLWWLDTRHDQRWYMLLNGEPMVCLSADESKGYAARFFYGNSAAVAKPGEYGALTAQTIRVRREVVISGGGAYERVTIHNHGLEPAEVQLKVLFGADFVDMFEVRGTVRKARGELLAAQVGDKSVTLGYRGLDNKLMQTSISFHTAEPLSVSGNFAVLHATVAPGQETTLDVAFSTYLEDCPILEEHPQPFGDFDSAAKAADDACEKWCSSAARVSVGNRRLQTVLDRALRDIYMLRIPTPFGPYVAAGIPWFYCPFGRDGLWNGLQMLPFVPELAREILVTHCGYQGQHVDHRTNQDVGNAFHEVHFGEMARLREVPFYRYYGTVDATPLFIVLFCRYVQWTGDLAFARKYWRHFRLAMRYVNRHAGRGYLAYGQKPQPGQQHEGLSNQDWKDAGDSIMYSDGELAVAPIATCNVQGYLLQAWESAAQLAKQLGYVRISRTLVRKAARLKKSFTNDYWMPEKNFLALALDGDGRQCDVVASNPGHVLRSGLLDADKAKAVAQRLQQPDMFSGWGVRTLAMSEKRYNPDSYQDGSVWWHDNGIICDGLMEIGEIEFAHAIFKAAVDAAMSAPDKRLRELDSGTARAESPNAPVGYPVACNPQLWGAGSVFMMLAATLGLNRREAQPNGRVLHVVAPALPDWLSYVAVNNLQVLGKSVDLRYATMRNGITACTSDGRSKGVRIIAES